MKKSGFNRELAIKGRIIKEMPVCSGPNARLLL
jgi:hypothetical protein